MLIIVNKSCLPLFYMKIIIFNFKDLKSVLSYERPGTAGTDSCGFYSSYEWELTLVWCDKKYKYRFVIDMLIFLLIIVLIYLYALQKQLRAQTRQF